MVIVVIESPVEMEVVAVEGMLEALDLVVVSFP